LRGPAFKELPVAGVFAQETAEPPVESEGFQLTFSRNVQDVVRAGEGHLPAARPPRRPEVDSLQRRHSVIKLVSRTGLPAGPRRSRAAQVLREEQRQGKHPQDLPPNGLAAHSGEEEAASGGQEGRADVQGGATGAATKCFAGG